jgi:hypothetical protein
VRAAAAADLDYESTEQGGDEPPHELNYAVFMPKGP